LTVPWVSAVRTVKGRFLPRRTALCGAKGDDPFNPRWTTDFSGVTMQDISFFHFHQTAASFEATVTE
jgi:hypothetical protein